MLLKIKTISFVSGILLAFGVVNAQKALFVGNSYTYVNDLPTMVRNLSNAGGITLNAEMSAPGGYTFEAHTTNTTTLGFLAMPGFDYAILQEQSQRPSFPQSQVQQEVYPYATILDSLFHEGNPCGQTVFLMTWGRKNGDAQNCPFWTPVCTYEGMQVELRRSYLNMAQQNQAIVAPAGIAWWEAMKRDTLLELYNADESHPEVTGTYLTACVLYATMFRLPSSGLNFYATLDSATAVFLQNVADDVVFDSLTTWRIGLDDLSADFSYQDLGGGNVSFSDLSANAQSWAWDFGDGNQSTLQNPQHTYSSLGTYVVSLTVEDGCDTLVFTDSVSVSLVGLENGVDEGMSIWPNPAKDIVHVRLHGGNSGLSLLDFSGRTLAHWLVETDQKEIDIDLRGLPAGVYWLRGDGTSNPPLKLIKVD